MQIAFISIAGLLGVLSRYFLGITVTHSLGGTFPYSTFIANIVGSFLIGLVYVFGFERAAISETLRLALMVGFLGGFTTFSSLTLETFALASSGKVLLAAINMIVSILFGLTAVAAGAFVARSL